MAKLPDATALGQLPIGPSGRVVSSYDTTGYARGAAALAQGTKDIGEGLSRAGREVASVAIEEKNKRDELEIAKAESEYLVRTTRLGSDLGDETDDKGLKEKYSPLFSKARDESAAMISDPRKRELWLAKRAPDVEKNLVAVDTRAFGILKDKEIASTSQALADLREAALRETDPAKVNEKVQAAHARLDALEKNGYIDAKTAQAHRQKWAQDYAKAWLEIQPPQERVKMLSPVPSLDQVVDKIVGVEYGSGKVFKNPNSSASGPGQVINSTWLSLIKKYRQDIAQGRSDAEILALRADEKLSKEMVKAYAVENSAYLEARGVAVNPGTIYLAHFLGPDGAARVLQAEPGKPVSEIVSRDAIRANPSILGGKTAGTVAQWATDKMGDPRNRPKMVELVPADDQKKLLLGAQSELNAQRVQRDVQFAQEQRERKRISDEAEGEWFTKILQNAPDTNAVAIAKDERLDVNARQQLVRILEQNSKADKTATTYGSEFYSLFQRVHAPEGDPNRITDPAVLYDHVREDGGLTLSGMEKLRAEIIGKRTPEGEAEAQMKKQFFELARTNIVRPDIGGGRKDRKGEELYLKFLAKATDEFNAGKKEGKSASRMLDPDSPDYIGKSIKQFVRPMSQMLNDALDDYKDVSSAPKSTATFDVNNVATLADLQKAHREGLVDAYTARAIAVQKFGVPASKPKPESGNEPRVTVPLSQ